MKRPSLDDLIKGVICVLWLMGSLGCAGLYFHDAGAPASPPPKYDLEQWPYDEFWTGIVFNGAKIGFTRFNLTREPEGPETHVITSESAMKIRFLGLDKSVWLKSTDRINRDLSLDSFSYSYHIDGSSIALSGVVEENRLKVEIRSRNQITRKDFEFKGKLYPTSCIPLFPLYKGLEMGRTYAYQAFDGETQTIGPVRQTVLAYETSDLFPGKAFKIETRFQGHRLNTWMDEAGKPLPAVLSALHIRARQDSVLELAPG